MPPIRVAIAAIAPILGGCATSVQLPAATNAHFDPIAWFTGASHGDGTLHKLFGSPVRTSVDSLGRRDGSGGLILDQAIREGDKPVRKREWTMRPLGQGRFTGTLTDASGPVDVAVSGARAVIRYPMKAGLEVRQQLALQSGGRTVLNRLSVRKFGLEVAHLDETIRK